MRAKTTGARSKIVRFVAFSISSTSAASWSFLDIMVTSRGTTRSPRVVSLSDLLPTPALIRVASIAEARSRSMSSDDLTKKTSQGMKGLSTSSVSISGLGRPDVWRGEFQTAAALNFSEDDLLDDWESDEAPEPEADEELGELRDTLMGRRYSIAVKGGAWTFPPPDESGSCLACINSSTGSNLMAGNAARIDGELMSLWARYFESPRMAEMASKIGLTLNPLGAGEGKASYSPSACAAVSAPGTT